jgi:two-component system chemotaxis response regulator CheB
MAEKEASSHLPKVIVVGGSAGSFSVVNAILSVLTPGAAPVVALCLHRLRHVKKGFHEALSIKSKLPVKEVSDKELLKAGQVYLAPANYHFSVEPNGRASLSTEPAVNYSRPSIDITMEAFGYAFGPRAIGVLLSGANRDGAQGLRMLHLYGGRSIVQDPESSVMPTMPKSALSLYTAHEVLDEKQISTTLQNIRL